MKQWLVRVCLFHALVRKGFYQDFPVEITEFLSRLFIPLEELEQIIAQANETSYDEAVQHYIDRH
jgi:glycine betaine/proline transport system substrate-binding protein